MLIEKVKKFTMRNEKWEIYGTPNPQVGPNQVAHFFWVRATGSELVQGPYFFCKIYFFFF